MQTESIISDLMLPTVMPLQKRGRGRPKKNNVLQAPNWLHSSTFEIDEPLVDKGLLMITRPFNEVIDDESDIDDILGEYGY